MPGTPALFAGALLQGMACCNCLSRPMERSRGCPHPSAACKLHPKSSIGLRGNCNQTLPQPATKLFLKLQPNSAMVHACAVWYMLSACHLWSHLQALQAAHEAGGVQPQEGAGRAVLRGHEHDGGFVCRWADEWWDWQGGEPSWQMASSHHRSSSKLRCPAWLRPVAG